MKTFIQKIINKRNPNFTFASEVKLNILIALVLEKAIAYSRGLRFLFMLRNNKHILLGAKVKFKFRNKITFGRWVSIGEYTTIKALSKEGVTLKDNVSIGAFSRLIVSTSYNNIGQHITIGNNVGIGEYAYLGGAGGLDIGDDCIIGQYFSCHPENHNFMNNKKLIREQGVSRKGIKIGKNCWIGAKVTILDGVTIGDNCVIAAGAVVTKDMPSYTVIGGVPAQVIKEIKKSKRTIKEIKTIYLNTHYVNYKDEESFFYKNEKLVCNAD